MEPALKMPLAIWNILPTALLLVATACAQEPYRTNTTIRFEASSKPCGDYDHIFFGTNHTIYFTTSFDPAPGFGGCITLANVFGSNNTDSTSSIGYRNTTYSYADNGGEYVHGNISYALSAEEFYNPRFNYTNVFYPPYTFNTTDRVSDDAAHERWLEGPDVYFYRNDDCSEDNDSGSMPWYQTNCVASDICQNLPFPVGSIQIYRPAEGDKQPDGGAQGICVAAPEMEMSAGNMLRSGWGWSLMGMVGVGVVHLLL